MQSFTPGQVNVIGADLVDRTSPTCDPITSGTVTGYLKVMSGVYLGKWWNAGSATWSEVEVSAGAMAHDTDGHWEVSIAAGAWISGVRYKFYAKESGNLHLPISDEISESTGPVSNVTVESSIIVEGTVVE